MRTPVNQRLRTLRPNAGFPLLWTLLLALSVCAPGCAQTPQEFVSGFDAALASGDPQRVAGLLTPQSRPIFMAMQQVQAAPLPDAATAVVKGAGHAAFVPGQTRNPTRFVSAHQDSSGIFFRVACDGEEREWMMQRNGLVWQLDLVATSSRASWTGF